MQNAKFNFMMFVNLVKVSMKPSHFYRILRRMECQIESDCQIHF